MAKFLFTYRPPASYTPGEADTMEEWNAFFEGLGEHLTDMGHPVFERTALGSPAGDTVLGGYSIVTAEDLEVAVTLAKACPILERGGGVEVGAITELDA